MPPSFPPVPRSQLMKTMLIMVKTKKGRGSMATFTMIAVIKNTSPMATRLPRMRTCWGILQERVSVRKAQPLEAWEALPRECQPKHSTGGRCFAFGPSSLARCRAKP